MEKYSNRSGDSGVVRFEPGADSILVEFRGGRRYLYTYGSTGEGDVEAMKRLAAEGRGLSTFISRYVRERYAEKLER